MKSRTTLFSQAALLTPHLLLSSACSLDRGPVSVARGLVAVGGTVVGASGVHTCMCNLSQLVAGSTVARQLSPVDVSS